MAPEVQSDDDFRALGLEPGAKPSEVKRAYRTLAKKWHPDRHQTASYEARALAEEKFREIDEAYRRISEPEKNSSIGAIPARGRRSRNRHPWRAACESDFSPSQTCGRKAPSGFSSKAYWPPSLSVAGRLLSGVAALVLFLILRVDPELRIGATRPTRAGQKVRQQSTTLADYRATASP